MSVGSDLQRLLRLRLEFGVEAARAKRALLAGLCRTRFRSSDELLAFHDWLCFVRAYPDDAALLRQVTELLEAFHARPDLKRFRRRLTDSGVAGSDIEYPFFFPTALWLARRFPAALEIDWPAWEGKQRLADLLHLLVCYAETPALDEYVLPVRGWLRLLAGPAEADGAFLVRRFAALSGDSFLRETLYDRLAPALRLRGSATTPSRTRAFVAIGRVCPQRQPLPRGRPRLRRLVPSLRARVRSLAPGEARRYVDLAREAMITRSRDLDAFARGDVRDVRLVDCGDGLAFACIGVVPERRLMLESVYGLLTLKNGVPVGYVLLSSLFGSTEIAYNVFETWRGAEAAHVFARVLAVSRALFGSLSFSIDPYQLGHFGNSEGLASGAWWFYYKLGFRPRDAGVKRIVREELARLRRDPRHRSSRATLERLSSAHVFLSLGDETGVALGALSPGRVGERVARLLAQRGGADREGSLRALSAETRRLLGVRSQAGWTREERLWWDRWSPLVLCIPGVARWPATARRALARVIRAKGRRRESEFVRRFDAHRHLRRAVLAMATPDE